MATEIVIESNLGYLLKASCRTEETLLSSFHAAVFTDVCMIILGSQQSRCGRKQKVLVRPPLHPLSSSCDDKVWLHWQLMSAELGY